ncbi:DUF6111 family protein [Stella sp.]|uniref:DUF6111 family protein n=1 Tax=Stella sp. TaxID=2912054 RepID=UPI0035B45453
MTRILLTIVLPLLAPAILYAAWFLLARRSAAARAADPDAPPPRVPWMALFLSGAALAAASLLWIAATGGDAPWGDHRPPAFRDGAVVPGGSG